MAALALTVLLALCWIAVVGGGYWHGGWRQVVLLAAMLLSYAVLSEWAAPNGRDLSARFGWSVARATTGVALLYLLAGTLLLGLLGSFALYRPRPLGPVERGLGATMGALNGGLLLALVLRTLRSYAFAAGRGQTLHDSPLSRFLIEDVGYLLLVALALSAVAAVVGLVAARRDAARERALLDAVAPPVVTVAIAERHDERPAIPVSPAQVPPAPHVVPPPAPVYATAPLIDWPTSPPPGVQTAPPSVKPPPIPDAPKVAPQLEVARPPSPLPARPLAPPRVLPPMVYPVADLIAAQAKPVRPVGPPPGTTPPAAVPPAEPSALQEPARVDEEREPPLSPSSLEVESPPVVRKIDVATRDVPVVQNDAASLPDAARTEPKPDAKGETMPADPHKPPAAPPMLNVMLATAAIPAIVPPRPPPIPATRPASAGQPPAPSAPPPASEQRAPMDEAAKARTGFARVAVARQVSGKPDETIPPPHPAPPPEPLQPPLPTGPRVHHCPNCGYPVRDHARYCPNCGSRQGR